jgi:hypothetical protein
VVADRTRRTPPLLYNDALALQGVQ